jgi:hypothetical protein
MREHSPHHSTSHSTLLSGKMEAVHFKEQIIRLGHGVGHGLSVGVSVGVGVDSSKPQ